MIARWYCALGHCTFSLLPDCLASHLPGTLAEVEAVVREVESSPSLEAACQTLRTDIDLPGALRWVRRRLVRVRTALVRLKGLLPHLLLGCEPSVLSFAQRLGVVAVLPAVREIGAPFLAQLPTPVGFDPRQTGGTATEARTQHPVGADPPPV